MKFKTIQEEFWAGAFGNGYIDRNHDELLIAANTALFSKIFTRTTDIRSVIELGSNIGLNLLAIRQLLPKSELSAVEINEKASSILKELGVVKVYNQSIFEFQIDYQREFVFTKGVLIHINPDFLPQAYDLMYNVSTKYICVAEYYNPTPQEMPYHGNQDRLFKRDFAGDLLKKFPDLNLVDYGFIYHQDPMFSLDDITWFLLEKR